MQDSIPTDNNTADELPEFDGRATYCPEDNKLRLYVGRVPRAEYEALRAEGWKALHKQREAGGGDFAATWTPARRRTALAYAGVIEDEDMGPEERAADRAERFAGYRDRRMSDAETRADAFDSGPSVHGYQSAARADRAARRHDKWAGRAVDAWDKAEYWQHRTAGVIAHALHVSSPSVRMGRIKILEAEIRKAETALGVAAARRRMWGKIEAEIDPAIQNANAVNLAMMSESLATYHHPRPEEVKNSYIQEKGASLYTLLTMNGGTYGTPISGAEAAAIYLARHPERTGEGPWLTHYRHRLAYETAMLEAQGGRAGELEIVPGGFIQFHPRRSQMAIWVQIRRVNKSPASGRVTSVMVRAAGDRWGNSSEGYHLAQVDVERMSPDRYRAPTPEELAEFESAMKREKAEAKARKPAPPPLVNPTDADADRLQAIWNERARAKFFEHNPHYRNNPEYFRPSTVTRMAQAAYSANSGGTYSRNETANLCADARKEPTAYNYNGRFGAVLAKVRVTDGNGNTTNKADSVIILTDKPQKAFPAALWQPLAPVAPTPEQAALTLA